jgi:hypothetical protein
MDNTGGHPSDAFMELDDKTRNRTQKRNPIFPLVLLRENTFGKSKTSVFNIKEFNIGRRKFTFCRY